MLEFLTDKNLNDMRGFLSTTIDTLPDTLPCKEISEYAEERRVLPTGPRPGPLDISYSEYLREPMNNMSPFSPIQHQAIMKAAQGGFTMMMECVLCYYIGHDPSDQLFVSSTNENISRWASRRLEPAIDSYGLRRYIYAQHQAAGRRKTGDTVYSKEYHGRRLDLASAQSPSGLRSMDKRILQRDEVDGAPPELATGEGNWLEVSYARTNFYGNRRKINDVSTPTTYDLSEIYRLYLEGDQRKYLVPCVHCQKKQELDFGNEKTRHGLKPETKAGILIDAYYICEHCHEAMFNYDKTYMILNGGWVPSTKSMSPVFRSYHWSSLLSPDGALPWLDMYKIYQKAVGKPDKMRAFTNLYLGLPFRETGEKPKLDKVIELRSAYSSGTVPDGVLFLTAFIDVQRGSEKDAGNPARLEMEICGHGPGYRTWSIMYKRIEGGIDDPFSGAWAKLTEWARETGLTFKNRNGTKFQVKVVLIDSGDGLYTEQVYRFTETWVNTYPSKGFSSLKKRKHEKEDHIDENLPGKVKRYRPQKISEAILLYEISTNYYKNQIYQNLKVPRNDTGKQRPGFCEFPIDYGEKYFMMLTAEEKLKDGSFRCPSGRRNEALDCRVGNLCAGDIFIDSYVLSVKARITQEGGTAADLLKANYRFCIDLMQKEVYGKIMY